ncbi:MAG TPA: helix-hairpin-helix domain-containing protein, partial [Deinococcales bacterium]|nr:helix-hairpin-helix domain-containing protein [Deinococcales bacterium]
VGTLRRYYRLKALAAVQAGLGALAMAWQAKVQALRVTPLPVTFPGRPLLLAAEYATLEDVASAEPGELQRIRGIGPALDAKIAEALIEETAKRGPGMHLLGPTFPDWPLLFAAGYSTFESLAGVSAQDLAEIGLDQVAAQQVLDAAAAMPGDAAVIPAEEPPADPAGTEPPAADQTPAGDAGQEPPAPTGDAAPTGTEPPATGEPAPAGADGQPPADTPPQG